MVEITVSGTLQDILLKFMSIKGLIEHRKSEGWNLFQDDENWVYESQQDERVCLRCEEFALNRTYVGSDVPLEFPDKELIEPVSLRPRVHLTYPYLRGDCRCFMWWRDYMFTLTERLGREIQETSA